MNWLTNINYIPAKHASLEYATTRTQRHHPVVLFHCLGRVNPGAGVQLGHPQGQTQLRAK